ncbi:hypothetical protein FGRMN_4293 [Fusarium graminum]|nr:hypothetical protein FGRMN_4293 [Fusarium graminum]
MDHLSGPVLLSGFLLSSIIYSAVFVVVDSLFRRFAPSLYEHLKLKDEVRALNPILLAMVRIAVGLTITLPSCVQAVQTTPWGVDQPLNTAGQVCVVSQLAVWSNELFPVRMYSQELFIHHILCLFSAANIILSPPIHQIKPLYMYYASMMGDVGPGSILILRLAGYHSRTSMLMYCVSFGSTMLLIFCRIGSAFYTLAHVLRDPYNPVDWIWAGGVLLFGFYSLYTAYCRLSRLEVIQFDPVRYRITCCYRLKIPISHLVMALACSASLLSTLFLYGLHLDRPMNYAEVHSLSLHSLITVAVGLTGAIIAGFMYPYNITRSNPWGRFYLPFGLAMAGIWISVITIFTKEVDRDIFLSSIGTSIPLFCTLARLAQYYSAQDAIIAREKPSVNNSGIERHKEIARENAVIFILSLTLLKVNILDLPETARLAVAACLVVQLRYRLNFVPLAVASLHGIEGILVAILLLMFEPGFFIFVTTARYVREEAFLTDILLNYALLGGTVLIAMTVAGGKKASVPCEGVKKPCEAGKSHTLAILFVSLFILQAMMARQYMMFEKSAPKTFLGFENFRSILSNPFTWVGLLHMASLPIVVLGAAE